MLEKSSEHLRNSLIMLEIGRKSFGNHCWPCFEVVENLSTLTFGYRWKSSENLRNLLEPSAIFGSLSKPSAIFGSRR